MNCPALLNFATHCPDGQKCGAATTGCRTNKCQRFAVSSTRRSDKCESCGYVESHDPNCPNPKLALPKTVREAIDKVTERVMDASLVESDLIELAETAMREARVSAIGENRLLDEAGKFFDWGNAASVAMKNLLDAYERRIRTLCTPEQLERKPWECAEFIEARRILDAKPNWFVTSDDTGVKDETLHADERRAGRDARHPGR